MPGFATGGGGDGGRGTDTHPPTRAHPGRAGGRVRALLTPDEKKKYFFKFNVDGLLRGDYQSRMNGYATEIGRAHV